MRAIELHSPGAELQAALRPCERPDPQPGPAEVLVRVAACAVCRTDLQLVSRDLPAHRLPVVPGHQVVGTVQAVGVGVDDVRLGERVGLVWLAGACGRCRFCLEGRENLCEQATFTGWDRDGGYATHVLAGADVAFTLPDLGPSYAAEGDAAVAPLLCGGVIGYRSLHIAGVTAATAPGLRLGLYGFGASATVVLQVARHWGADVHVVTRSDSEAARALALGATSARTYAEGPPVRLDAAITFAPAGAVVVAALQALDRGGVVAVNAIHLDEVPAFDYDDLWHERVVRSVANVTRADVREFLALVAEAGVRTTFETMGLDDAAHALERLRDGDIAGAVVLRP